MPVVQRVLVAGDTHGNGMWLEVLFNHAVAQRCDALLQLGDFGYWPHENSGRRFLRRAEFLATRAGIPLVWIDGNHENHTELRRLPRREDGFVEVSPDVLYAPRGHRWTWSGVRFGAIGGAFSIDWRFRTLGRSWWAEEAVVDEDLVALGTDRLDVLVAHDAPAGIPIYGERLNHDDELRSYANRKLVADAVFQTWPRLLLHGHWHHRYGFDLRSPFLHQGSGDLEFAWSCRVEGLASDQERDGTAWGVLELPSCRFVDGTRSAMH